MAGITAVYVDADSFTVATDRTSEFSVGRRVRAYCGTDGYKYGTVESSSYSDPNTTVNLKSANDDLTTNLTEVQYGEQSQGTTGSVPEHDHDGAEGSGGIVDGSALLDSYSSTMTGNETFTAPSTSERKYFLDPSGAARNFNPSGTFTAGYQATVINVGGSYNIVFDSSGLAQTLTPGSMGTFIYDGSQWW